MRTIKNIFYLLVIIFIALFVVILIWVLMELFFIIVGVILVIMAIYFGYKCTLGKYDKNNWI